MDRLKVFLKKADLKFNYYPVELDDKNCNCGKSKQGDILVKSKAFLVVKKMKLNPK